MDKFWVVAKREYLERVRSRWFVMMTLFIPVFITAAFLVPVWVTARSAAGASMRNILILDATGAGLGKRVADVLMRDTVGTPNAESLPSPQVQEVAQAQLSAVEDSATRVVMQNPRASGYKAIVGYLVLDDSTVSNRRLHYAGRNASSIVDMEKLKTAVRQAFTGVVLQREGVKPETIALISNLSLDMPATRVDERGKGASGQAAIFLGIGIGVLLLMSIIFHGQFVLRGVLEEKQTRVAEVVISSIKPEMLLAGKVAGAGAVGLTQQFLWIGISAWLITNVAPLVLKSAGTPITTQNATSLSGSLGGLTPALFVVVLLYFLLGFTFYASLLAAAGSMVNNEQDAQQAAMPVMYLLIGAWLFVNSVIVNPSGRIATVLSWLPFSSPIIMPMRVGLSSVSWASIVGSLAVCALGCLGAVWIAARIYRVGMLMYGKKPSLAEVAKWVKYA
ncbi:MAG TPA: ABC transporter permease [Gemmatimonadaceae bacterium]|nr:ABC transporter permease [Gemmatimonadaceae bacterium]